MTGTALLADIGGTNARFALLVDGRPGNPVVLATGDFASLDEALAHALGELGSPRLEAAAACAAGPPSRGRIVLTNCPWSVEQRALAGAAGGGRVMLVNDFTALAAALPVLDASGLRHLGGGAAAPGSARAVIGPGTGLGVSAWIPDGDACISGEGGHVDLASGSDQEDAILARLRGRFGHVSAERVLCGAGLVNLWQAMHPGEPGAPASGPELADLARGGDARAVACVAQFCRFLGAVAGDVALTLGARGGVYLAGGILPAWGDLFDDRGFRERFEAKGRYRDYLAAIPTYMITTPYPALAGLARLLARDP